MIRIPFEEMISEFRRVLEKIGFTPSRAEFCARILAENTLDGVASHGVNRFQLFVNRVKRGKMDPNAEPEKIASFGAWEQWDGKLGPGPLNAAFCTDRAIELSKEFGIGCVALRHTTHWMRGGTYGWRAANAGFAFIGWTNTMPNMPSWGAKDCRIGNNPLVLAMPREKGHVVLDMAMSQFSYGKMETMHLLGKELPLIGGFDTKGNLTKDPDEILKSWRPLPIGYWKGSGLSIMLDIFAAVLSNGLATYQIGKLDDEYHLSQIFIVIDVERTAMREELNKIVDGIIEDLHSGQPDKEDGEILYPGERALHTRKENLKNGIPVDEGIWKKILEM